MTTTIKDNQRQTKTVTILTAVGNGQGLSEMRHRRTRLIWKDALASSTAFSTVSSFSDKIISTWQGQFLKHQTRSCSITCMIKISACQIIGIAGIAWECAQNPELVWGRHMYGPIRPWARYVRLRPCWAAFTSSSCRRIKKKTLCNKN